MTLLIRLAFAASLAVAGVAHAYLYVHGYRHIPDIGASFLVQAGVSFALGLLILLGGPGWLRWAGAAVAGGSLVAFALSRTVGLLGFSERGWDPAPYAAMSVGAEVVTVVLWAVDWVIRRMPSRWHPGHSELQKARGPSTSA
ncbi:hypothetical protein [Mycobacterium malmoense]|uniref:hypothetical protein n=1 Tax=Mycobacterium malmoense TaxID=1780 RepID=UPI0009F416CE|nr:hypothetical protein [Mycobacterium malmoense]